MENLNIGRSGIEVPFWAWAPGPSAAAAGGATTMMPSVKAIQTAVEQGIRWIDTAPIYGLYHSETVVGEALKHIDRDKVVLSTNAAWSGGMKRRCSTRSWTAPPSTGTSRRRASLRTWRTACAAWAPTTWMCCTPTGRARTSALSAGGDRGGHDEAEGAGQDPRHWCVQRDGGSHPGLLPVRAAGCHSGKVQPADPPHRKAAPAHLQGAGCFGAGLLPAGAGSAHRQGHHGDHLPRGQHPEQQSLLPACRRKQALDLLAKWTT